MGVKRQCEGRSNSSSGAAAGPQQQGCSSGIAVAGLHELRGLQPWGRSGRAAHGLQQQGRGGRAGGAARAVARSPSSPPVKEKGEQGRRGPARLRVPDSTW